MSRRGNIITIAITALILGGIFYFVKYDKTNPLSLIDFNANQYQNDYIANLMRKAETGDPQAMLDLATAYEKGKLVPKNDEQVKLWRKTAIEVLEKKADAGDVKAMFYLALAYEEGKIVEKNDKTASEWYLKGAEAGHASSQYNLGLSYRHGLSTNIDYEKALYWFEKAAKQDYSHAIMSICLMHYNGQGVPKNLPKAFELCMDAANKRDLYASYMVGFMYKYGQGVEKNKTEAAKWLAVAARNHHPDSNYLLAMLYEDGDGVQKDFLKAGELYRKAGTLGSEDAKKYLWQQANICRILVPPDFKHEHLAKACILSAENGEAQIQAAMGYMYQFGETLQKNEGESVIWYRKGAEQGNIPAQVMLANAYLQGTGIENDLIEAYAWSNLAAGQEPKTNWDKFAKQQNELSILKAIEAKITPEQKQQALERAEEYRKKYEKKETPP